MTEPKLAIVADWLPTYGGAEHVIAEFIQLWPNAPIFTTVAKHGKLGPLDSADIRTTPLQKWYRLIRNHQLLLSFMPKAVENMNVSPYDVIVSSSHAVAKGIIPSSHAVHVCYCHTPMRYAWEMEEQYLDDFRIPRLLRKYIRTQLKTIRRWDLSTAKRVDMFIANSRATQERIRRIYGRESVVLPPPVDARFFETELVPDSARNTFLALGRLVPYKRFDLLIEVANTLKLPLTIAGTGQDEARLKKMAGPTVKFVGYVPQKDLPSMYAHAKAVLFPQVEDAGVVPLEAQACGTPVIALGKGGALDSVSDGRTGLFFPEQTAESLTEALRAFERMNFYAGTIRNHAKQFSAEGFRKRMQQLVQQAIQHTQR